MTTIKEVAKVTTMNRNECKSIKIGKHKNKNKMKIPNKKNKKT